MGRYLTITIASILALAIAGCSGEEEQQTVEPTPTETAENNQGKKNFENPVVPAKTSTTEAPLPSNLLGVTDTGERLAIVTKGRADPFDGITSPVFTNTNKDRDNTVANNKKRAVPALPPLPTSSRTTPSRQRPRRSAVISATTRGSSRNNSATTRGSSRNNSNSSKTTLRPKPKQTATKPSSNSGSVTPVPVVPKVMPGVIPQPDLASVLPPAPQPKLAQAVLVSGIIQVGNQPQAIIKVPSEPTSRYVQAGQRLASGLLVKRIEMNEGSEPIVILEQYGIEVARMVGEAPMGAIEPTTASTPNSVSTLPLLPNPVSVGAS